MPERDPDAEQELVERTLVEPLVLHGLNGQPDPDPRGPHHGPAPAPLSLQQPHPRLGYWARRVIIAVTAVASFLLFGGLLVWTVTGRTHPIQDAFFYALITISTVGYDNMGWNEPEARAVTWFLIIGGVGTIAFFQSTMTAMLVEGVIAKAFRRKKMDRSIAALQDHFIVAGGGRTGTFVIDELVKLDRDFVLIESEQEVVDRLNAAMEKPLLHVLANATSDQALLEAGLQRARGLISALPTDRDNLFVTLSARALNDQARIVAKVVDLENEKKMLTAGADATVAGHRIGGLRLVSEMVRPNVTEFLDGMLRVSRTMRFDELAIPAAWSGAGSTIREAGIRENTGALVVALREADGTFHYTPSPDQTLDPGMHVIVIGELDSIASLRRLLGAPAPG